MRAAHRALGLDISTYLAVGIAFAGRRRVLVRTAGGAPDGPISIIPGAIHRLHICSSLGQLAAPLRPGQVNHIQKALARIALVVEGLDPYLENVVAPTRCFIDPIVLKYALLLGHHYNIQELLRVLDWYPDLTRAEYLTLIALNLQILILISRQQVSNILAINFKS